MVGHEGYEFVHPEDRERNADALGAVLSNPSESETVEARFRHADGSWRWVEATVRNRLDDEIKTADEMTFQGDPDRLRHVFENLFRNAVEHGGSDVTVRVGCHDEQGIYVEDDGPGIPAEKCEEVFEPGHSSARGGTGFGLTVLKRILKAHGWELSVTDGTDGGVRFVTEMADQNEFA